MAVPNLEVCEDDDDRQNFRSKNTSVRPLARVEAGEDFVIARGNDPIAHVTRIRKETDLQLLLTEVRAARQKATVSTNEEILSWRDEGRR